MPSSGDAGNIVPEVALALGSNLGDRRANLLRAVELLGMRGVRVTGRSSIWETAPVPNDQPGFLNAVVLAETELDPVTLLATAKAIERELGRTPGRRWGPRPIDIDILFHGTDTIDTPELTIPHSQIANRDFVLVPLAEVMPGPLPVFAKSAEELLARLPLSSATYHSRFEP